MPDILIEPVGGISGDMFVAALADAGGYGAFLKREIARMKIGGLRVSFGKKDVSGIRAATFSVSHAAAGLGHRNLSEVMKVIRRGRYGSSVMDRAEKIFTLLARAEAKVHGSTLDKIHFHEVGAIDSIVDVAGAAILLDKAGAEKVRSLPLPTGSGVTTCRHGSIPVPAPAVLELAKRFPLKYHDRPDEMTTPTGAAIVAAFAGEFRSGEVRVTKTGVGAGSREYADLPNILRVSLCEFAGSGDGAIWQIETNIDDLAPEAFGAAFESLFAAGARDVYVTSVQMKKNRPGQLLTVLCEKKDIGAIERTLFTQTTTFGVRKWAVDRTVLARRLVKAVTPFGTVRIKLGADRDGKVITASAEAADVAKAAARAGVSFREAMQHANGIGAKFLGDRLTRIE